MCVTPVTPVTTGQVAKFPPSVVSAAKRKLAELEAHVSKLEGQMSQLRFDKEKQGEVAGKLAEKDCHVKSLEGNVKFLQDFITTRMAQPTAPAAPAAPPPYYPYPPPQYAQVPPYQQYMQPQPSTPSPNHQQQVPPSSHSSGSHMAGQQMGHTPSFTPPPSGMQQSPHGPPAGMPHHGWGGSQPM